MRLLPSLALLAAACAALPASAKVWTVTEAVATALRQNPDADAARHRIDAAQALITQANSAWLPQLSVSGGYLSSNGAMSGLMSSLAQRNFGFGLNFNRPGWVDNLNVTGTVAYNLYGGGRPSATRAAARAGSRAAEQELRAVQQQLTAEVVKAALHLRTTRESVAALEAGLSAYEANLANARLRFEAGQMLKADLLSLEVQAARTREMLVSARHGAALAARAFYFVLGADDATEPVEFAADDAALAALAIPESADFTLRPELVALTERVRAAESMVEAARGGRRPNVNAFVSAQYDQGWRYDRHADSVQGGVTVDFNLFDAGQTSGRISQAQAELAQAKDQLRKATLAIGLEVEQARLAHADARERLAVTAGAVSQAEESAALSRARFEKGALLAAELIGSESRLIEARLSRTLAVADECLARLELRRAVGLPVLTSP